jgi:hypothetical protein
VLCFPCTRVLVGPLMREVDRAAVSKALLSQHRNMFVSDVGSCEMFVFCLARIRVGVVDLGEGSRRNLRPAALHRVSVGDRT